MFELLSVLQECGDYIWLLNKVSKHVGSKAYVGKMEERIYLMAQQGENLCINM